MTKLSFSIDDSEIREMIKKFPAETEEAIEKSLLQSALEVQNQAKINAPYLTGNLRGSITHRITKKTAEVGTDVIYAPVQEFGADIYPVRARALKFRINGKWVTASHVRVPPYKGRGFLRPALEDKRGEIIRFFDVNIKEALKKI